MENGKKCKYAESLNCELKSSPKPEDYLICMPNSIIHDINRILLHLGETPIELQHGFGIYENLTHIRLLRDGFNELIEKHYPAVIKRMGRKKAIIIMPILEREDEENPLVI